MPCSAPGRTNGGRSARRDGPGGDDGWRTFLAEDVIVGTGSRQVQARFVSLLQGTWLATASQAAYGETVTGLLRAGPARGAVTKFCPSARPAPGA